MKLGYKWIAFVLLPILAMAGCQWAKFEEVWSGPKASASKSVATDGNFQYVPIGTGRWVDDAGKMHTQMVYVRVSPEGVRGPVGERGPVGPSRDGKVEVEPTKPSVGYKADTGTYRRETSVMGWGSDPAKTISGIKPFEAKKVELPDYRNDGTSVRGGGGSFSGGGMESIQDVVRRGPILLCVIGALALLGGIVLAVWAKQVTLGLAIAGGGGVLIAAGILFESYPWILLIAAVAVLGLIIWWLLDANAAAKARDALAVIVRGVEAAPADAQVAVKTSIASASTAAGKASAVKSAISKAKVKAGV